MRDVIIYFAAQFMEGLNKQSGGGLSIDIKIAPDKYFFAPAPCRYQSLNGIPNPGEAVVGGGVISFRIQEADRLVERVNSTCKQRFGDDWMPTNLGPKLDRY